MCAFLGKTVGPGFFFFCGGEFQNVAAKATDTRLDGLGNPTEDRSGADDTSSLAWFAEQESIAALALIYLRFL